MSTKPFIYIAALRRTGSNLLCEALTLPPFSYVLREPGFARAKFAIKPNDRAHFGSLGVDLHEFRERLLAAITTHKGSRRRGRAGADLFIDDLLPRLAGVVHQVGIKEITHRNWSRYAERVPSARFIILARDPRDIFLSLMQKSRERRVNRPLRVTPSDLADNLLRQFQFQRTMLAELSAPHALTVRYEDLCTQPAAIHRIKRFVESDIPDIGQIGGLNRHNASVHGAAISTTSVARWTREADPALRSQAQHVFDLMGEYNEFWGYRRT